MKTLFQLLDDYQPFDANETHMVARLRTFLAATQNGETPFGRELAGEAPDWGHVTGSAWIVNSDFTRVVMLYHGKLGRWLQPGGHCEAESDVCAVAMREAREETGLEVVPLEASLFDVDVHLIPEYWNTPDHWHYDVRFLLRADATQTPVASAESRAVRWVSLDDAEALAQQGQPNREASIERMIEKTRRLAIPPATALAAPK